jgi:hypothetical protein
VTLTSEGAHSILYWSVDKAGNVETGNTVTVQIDKTSPTISHSQSPVANGNGWNNSAVTVTFICSDALSGIASCTSPQTVTVSGGTTHTFSVKLTNSAGTSTYSYSWFVL